MTPEERCEYGGAWMSLESLGPHYALYVERGSPIFVAEDDSGRIVGNLDLWLADEPEPVGRNAFVEIVVEHAEYVGSGLENAMLGYAAEVARALGYPALDGSFGIGGLSDDYFAKRAMGFRIWDEHDRVDAACGAGVLPKLAAVPATGDATRGLVVVGRWAPTEYVWLAGRADEEGLRLGTAVMGERCLIQAADAARWRGKTQPGFALDVTFYVPPERTHDAALVSELFRAFAAYGASQGFRMFCTWIPSTVAHKLSGVEVLSAAYAGTCLRMRL
jgi:GNAT superfamily N-acetyltransferase